MTESERTGWRRRAAALNQSPRLLGAARRLREVLPGDSRYGDPLSTAGSTPADALMRRLSDLTAERPGLLREVGLSALQLWQAAAEAQGRGQGDTELAIAFTDLEDFSEYALAAGDEAALDLLRAVGHAVEPAVKDGGGQIVKRLGDGVMAVFPDAPAAVAALCRAAAGVEALETTGEFKPRLRAGVHTGRPRRLAGDFFGVDVNLAARLAEQASGGEILVSDAVAPDLGGGRYEIRRKRRFKVKGVPRDVSAFIVKQV